MTYCLLYICYLSQTIRKIIHIKIKKEALNLITIS